MRRVYAQRESHRISISIHAPLAGCDRMTETSRFDQDYFNPRTPCGVRRRCHRAGVVRDGRFQSTHPLRGATGGIGAVLVLVEISIHAPLAGCDYWNTFFDHFDGISIHAPLAGCDQSNPGYPWDWYISIHAPLAGCDDRGSCNSGSRRYFNPRTPYGVRRRSA